MKPAIMAAAAAVFLLAACGKDQAPPPAASGQTTFTFASVGEIAVRPEHSAPAAVIGRNEARLSAEVTATVLAMPVDVGAVVKRGEIVARLDPRDALLAVERAAAALAQARARHAQASAQLQRARALHEKNFYSAEALTLRETELAAAAADLRAASAQHDTARRALEKHTLRAPFDAVVRARSGQVGELATPGTPLLTLVDTTELQLAAQLQLRDAELLAQADELVFVAGDRRQPVRLLRVSPALNRDSRSVEVRLAFVGAPPPAGLEGRLSWRDPRPHLPADLLVRRDGRYGVFLAVDGKAHFHALPQAQEGRPAPIDLPADALVVTGGRHALQEGVTLR